jgi:hypothetical protein
MALTSGWPKESSVPEKPLWYFTRVGKQTQGPFTDKRLKQLAAMGQLLPTDKVHKLGMEKPLTARKVPGLFDPPPETP